MKEQKWIGYTKDAYLGQDEYGDIKWSPRKFYRCPNCRRGTAVQTNFCPDCGAKLEKADVYPSN